MKTIEQRFESDFKLLKEKGRLVENWSNVYNHCKLEAVIAEVLSDMLELSPDDKVLLTRAAILHDWSKRIDIETQNFDTDYSYNKLIEYGVDERICEIAHSVGHTSLKWIENCDVLRKAMHFIDDIVLNTDIVSINERVDRTEKTGRYTELSEKSRKDHDGRTFFDVQKEVGNRIQTELEVLCNVTNGSLVEIIKGKVASQL